MTKHEPHRMVRWHAPPEKVWISRARKRDFSPSDTSFEPISLAEIWFLQNHDAHDMHI